MGPTWGAPRADRTQVGPMLAPWALLSGSVQLSIHHLDSKAAKFYRNNWNFKSKSSNRCCLNCKKAKLHDKILHLWVIPFRQFVSALKLFSGDRSQILQDARWSTSGNLRRNKSPPVGLNQWTRTCATTSRLATDGFGPRLLHSPGPGTVACATGLSRYRVDISLVLKHW